MRWSRIYFTYSSYYVILASVMKRFYTIIRVIISIGLIGLLFYLMRGSLSQTLGAIKNINPILFLSKSRFYRLIKVSRPNFCTPLINLSDPEKIRPVQP